MLILVPSQIQVGLPVRAVIEIPIQQQIIQSQAGRITVTAIQIDYLTCQVQGWRYTIAAVNSQLRQLS